MGARRLIKAPYPPRFDLDERCRGCCDDERSWVALSPNDRWILRQHLDRGLCRGWELFFGVPATGQAIPENVQWTPAVRSMAEYLWPHRMDLVARRGRWHWIVEIKPCASYLALGQVLFYRERAPVLWKQLAGAGIAVLTDRCEYECRCVFERFGVVVHELPDLEAIPIRNVKT